MIALLNFLVTELEWFVQIFSASRAIFLYLVIVVGPQIWTESKLFYENLTIQTQKLMIFENNLGN